MLKNDLSENRMNFRNVKKQKQPGAAAELWEKAPWLQKNAEEIKEARKSQDTDDLFDVLVYDPIAIRLSHGFIRAGIPANMVTVLSLFVGVGGSICLYSRNIWVDLAGMVMIIFAAILDCCDGQVARLTGTSSQLGRVLDGAVDIANFLAIYLVLGLRLMSDTIPFTDMQWGFLVWIPIVLAMISHADQARMADYYRGLHLFFLNGKDPSLLTTSKELKAELYSLPKGSSLFERIYRIIYLIYTKDQERQTPRVQRLLNGLEKNRTDSEKVSEAYVSRSLKYIKISGGLTYNIRTYVLFIAILFNVPAVYFVFVIIVLQLVKVWIVRMYEAIAKEVYEKYLA